MNTLQSKVEILPVSELVLKKLKKYNLSEKFKKQILLLENNFYHPGLNCELLKPKKMGIYSFRIDRKFRALFIFHKKDSVIEILNITVHYR